jgi:hypothetical protein
MGGTIGSFLPGYFFERFGWQVFLASLLCVLVLALLFVQRLSRAVSNLA